MNNYRLHLIGNKDSPLCTICNVSETNIHMMIYCNKIQNCMLYLCKLIFYLCDLNTGQSIIKYLFFQFPKINKKIRNTLCIVLSSYISIIWSNREDPENLLNKFKAKILRDQRLNMLILDSKAKDIFTENYCKINMQILRDL